MFLQVDEKLLLKLVVLFLKVFFSLKCVSKGFRFNNYWISH